MKKKHAPGDILAVETKNMAKTWKNMKISISKFSDLATILGEIRTTRFCNFFGDEILGPENLVATKFSWAAPKVRITTSDYNDQKEHRILRQTPKSASNNSSWRSRKNSILILRSKIVFWRQNFCVGSIFAISCSQNPKFRSEIEFSVPKSLILLQNR